MLNPILRVDAERMDQLIEFAEKLGYVLYRSETQTTQEDYPKITLVLQQGFGFDERGAT